MVTVVMSSGCAGPVDTDVLMSDYVYEPHSITFAAAAPGFELSAAQRGLRPPRLRRRGLPEDVLVRLAVLPDGEVAHPLAPIPAGAATSCTAASRGIESG